MSRAHRYNEAQRGERLKGGKVRSELALAVLFGAAQARLDGLEQIRFGHGLDEISCLAGLKLRFRTSILRELRDQQGRKDLGVDPVTEIVRMVHTVARQIPVLFVFQEFGPD